MDNKSTPPDSQTVPKFVLPNIKMNIKMITEKEIQDLVKKHSYNLEEIQMEREKSDKMLRELFKDFMKENNLNKEEQINNDNDSLFYDNIK